MRALGVVKWTKVDKGGHPIAGVQPLYEVGEPQWRKIASLEEFPSQGQAFWPAAHTATDGLLVFFWAEPNAGQRDEYRVSDPKPAIEILDAREFGSPAEVRTALVEGLRAKGVAARRAFVWCKPDVLVGPVELIRTSSGMLRLAGTNLARVTTFAGGEPKRILDGRVERLIRIDDSPVTGYVDWDDDATVLRRALDAAVRVAKQAGKDTGQTKRKIEDAAKALAAQGLGTEAQLDLYRLERARALCQNTTLIAKLAPDIVEGLRAHPSVSQNLALIEGETRKVVEQDARVEVAKKLAQENLGLQQVVNEHKRARDALAEEERKLVEIRREVEQNKKRADEISTAIDSAVEKRVRDALARPAELLAEASVLRPLLVHPEQSKGSSRSSPARTVPSKYLQWPVEEGETIKDRPILLRTLIAAARARGVAPQIMIQVHAAVSAGLVPVLIGPGALGGLAAYAHAVCNDRLAVLSVSPGFIQPQDMIGSVVAGSLIPHSTGLLSVAAAASATKGASLLILEGANRSPLESLLLPLLQLSDAGLPFYASLVDEPILRPPGLRFAATLVSGATTVPVTPQLWCHAVAILADQIPKESLPVGRSGVPLTSELFTLGDVPQEVIGELIDAWPGCSELRGSMERFGAALGRFYSDPSRLRNALLEGIVLPYLASTLTDDEQAGAISKLVDPNDKALSVVLSRLRKGLR